MCAHLSPFNSLKFKTSTLELGTSILKTNYNDTKFIFITLYNTTLDT